MEADGGRTESPLAALTRAMEEKDEELRSWRLGCLQAEAEVRALKRQMRQPGPPSPETVLPTSPGSAASSHVRAVKEAEAQATASPALVKSEQDPGTSDTAEVNQLREDLRRLQQREEAAGDAPATPQRHPLADLSAEELEELKQQLLTKNFTILQLQADMTREKQQVERQRRSEESQNMICREELREMTSRAESLSEEVKKSKKRVHELQAVREECARIRSELEASEKRLRSEASVNSQLRAFQESAQATIVTLKEELTAGQALGSSAEAEVAPERNRSKGADSAGLAGEEAFQESETADFAVTQELLSGTSGSAAASSQSGRQRLVQGVAALRQLGGELHKELKSAAGRNTTALRGAAGQSFLGEKAVAKLLKQIEKVQQLVEGSSSLPRNAPVGSGDSLVIPAAGPEGEHPPPEERHDRRSPVSDLAGGRPVPEALQQKLMEVRLAAEAERQALMDQHNDELRQLGLKHDMERRELQSEIGELKAKFAHVEVNSQLVQPMADLRGYFESQVKQVKTELLVQIADLYEQQKVQRAGDDAEKDRLRRQVETCRTELKEWREQYEHLALEHRQLQRSHDVLLRSEDMHETIDHATPMSSEVTQAIMATMGTYDGMGDTLEVHPTGPVLPVDKTGSGPVPSTAEKSLEVSPAGAGSGERRLQQGTQPPSSADASRSDTPKGGEAVAAPLPAAATPVPSPTTSQPISSRTLSPVHRAQPKMAAVASAVLAQVNPMITAIRSVPGRPIVTTESEARSPNSNIPSGQQGRWGVVQSAMVAQRSPNVTAVASPTLSTQPGRRHTTFVPFPYSASA